MCGRNDFHVQLAMRARDRAIKYTWTNVGYVGISFLFRWNSRRFGTRFKQKQLQSSSSPVFCCPTAIILCVRNAAFHRYADKVQTQLEGRSWLLRARRTSLPYTFRLQREMKRTKIKKTKRNAINMSMLKWLIAVYRDQSIIQVHLYPSVRHRSISEIRFHLDAV